MKETNTFDEAINLLARIAYQMERSPRPWSIPSLGEEDIRDFFLCSLNVLFTGGASGETFNKGGKTDILIKEGSEVVFIGECKFWEGGALFNKTIDQIRERYLAWRDIKAAVLIFNRNKNTTEVLKQLPSLIQEHAHYQSGYSQISETHFQGLFSHAEDADRTFQLHIAIFNLPSTRI